MTEQSPWRETASSATGESDAASVHRSKRKTGGKEGRKESCAGSRQSRPRSFGGGSGWG